MSSKRRTWLSAIGAVLVTGGLVTSTVEAQVWDKNYPEAARFQKLAAFQNQAVLDKNTGLVWEQAPGPELMLWSDAAGWCLAKTVGLTRGWRLPSVMELVSVLAVEPGGQAFVPPVFTFAGGFVAPWWTATTMAPDPGTAWTVDDRGHIITSGGKQFGTNLAWCVRGPMQESVY